MTGSSTVQQANALRAANHYPQGEPPAATLARALAGADDNPIIDAEKLRVGDATHLAAVRAMVGFTYELIVEMHQYGQINGIDLSDGNTTSVGFIACGAPIAFADIATLDSILAVNGANFASPVTGQIFATGTTTGTFVLGFQPPPGGSVKIKATGNNS